MSATSSNKNKDPNRSCYGRLLRRVKSDPTGDSSSGQSKATAKPRPKKSHTAKKAASIAAAAATTSKKAKKHAF